MKIQYLKVVLLCLFSMVTLNANADWQCYAADKNGHFWKSEGSTQDRASAVAMSFCSAYSPDGPTCQIDKCLTS